MCKPLPRAPFYVRAPAPPLLQRVTNPDDPVRGAGARLEPVLDGVVRLGVRRAARDEPQRVLQVGPSNDTRSPLHGMALNMATADRTTTSLDPFDNAAQWLAGLPTPQHKTLVGMTHVSDVGVLLAVRYKVGAALAVRIHDE
jgi:hypothetical protein